MGRSKRKSFSITLILSIIFAVICIIAVWNVKVGDHEKGLQPDYVEPETETMPYESIKPPTEEKTDKIIIASDPDREGEA
ncbi:MAG TPA: toprim domain-containing protein, partial [bacterium]|nr:toprim domain-containing protein [bacterium]